MPTATPVDRPRPGWKQPGRSVCAVLLGAVLAGGGMHVPAGHAQVTATGEYLERMDTDGDGRVSLPEYVEWMGYAFRGMDRNGDGVLSPDELPGGRGRPVTLEQHRERLSARFARQDADGDGFLSARELAAPPR